MPSASVNVIESRLPSSSSVNIGFSYGRTSSLYFEKDQIDRVKGKGRDDEKDKYITNIEEGGAYSQHNHVHIQPNKPEAQLRRAVLGQ